VFFLGGAQIDGEAKINLVRADGKRFPGSFGSAYMYPIVPRVILFREEHSPRVLVKKVDFVSASGNPAALVTGKALFSWQRDQRRFCLESVHPGHSADEIRKDTGFDYDAVAPKETPAPSVEEINLLRTTVKERIAPDYPDFARRVWG
jgi:glutaconate CoA-transferase subunit B